MYIVYILQSDSASRYYIGCSSNPEIRLRNHNNGRVCSTKAYRRWKIVYTEKYKTKDAAFKRERVIKSYKAGEAFQRLINK